MATVQYISTAGAIHSPSGAQDRGILPANGIATWPDKFHDSGENRTYFAGERISTREHSTAVIQYLDHDTHLLSPIYRIGSWTDTDDEHGQPAICQNSNGNIIAFFAGHHAVAMQWSISDPDDPSKWTAQTALSIEYTYPKPVSDGNDVHLIVRKRTAGAPGKMTLVYRKITNTHSTPTAGSEVVLIDFGTSGDGSRIYAGEVHRIGTKLHFCWTAADYDDTTRDHVYYGVYDTVNGDLETFGGTSVASGSLPISRSTADLNFRIFEHTGSNRGSTPSLQFDTNNQPHVLFPDGTGTSFSLKHIYHNGTAWSTPATVATIVDRDSATGYIQNYCLVPGASGTMWAVYSQNEASYTTRGGDTTRRIWTAGTWAAAATLATAGTNAHSAFSAVRDAHADFRVGWDEISQTNDYTDAPNLKRFAYGENGFVYNPDRPDYQHMEVADERVLLRVDPNTNAIDDMSGQFRSGDGEITVSGVTVSSGLMSFDGTNDVIEIDDSGAWTLDGAFTGLFKKVKFTSATADQILAAHFDSSGANRGWLMRYVGSSNQLRLAMYSNGASHITNSPYNVTWTATPGQEYDIAFERDFSDNVRIFVDGVEVGSGTTMSGSSFNSSETLTVGAFRSSGSLATFFGGTMESFTLYQHPAISVTTQAVGSIVGETDSTFDATRVRVVGPVEETDTALTVDITLEVGGIASETDTALLLGATVSVTVLIRDADDLTAIEGATVVLQSAGGDDDVGTAYFFGATDASGQLSGEISVGTEVEIIGNVTRTTPPPAYLPGKVAATLGKFPAAVTIHGFLSADPTSSPFTGERFTVADRVLKILTNDRFSAVGLFLDRNGFYAACQDKDDELTYTLDFQDWLGDSETILSYSQTARGCALSQASATTSQIQFEVSAVNGTASVETTITTSTGDVLVTGLRFYEKDGV